MYSHALVFVTHLVKMAEHASMLNVSVVRGYMEETTVRHLFVRSLVKMEGRAVNRISVLARLDMEVKLATSLFVSEFVRTVENASLQTLVSVNQATPASGVISQLASQIV